MKRTRNLLGLTFAAIALTALTGCASGADDADTDIGTVDTEAPVEASDESTTDESAEEDADSAAPSLDGEGIAYGATSLTGVDLDLMCMGTGADLTMSGTGSDADGNLHSVGYAGGSFSYSVLSEDMTSEATSLIAGDEAPGTDVTVEESDGSYTFTGTVEVASTDGTSGKESFTANFTCDSTV